MPLAAAEEVPLPVVTRPPSAPGAAPARHLPQPCAGLADRACRCYGARPGACRQFRCLLLTALEAGEVDLADAVAVVERTRAASPPERASSLRFHFGRR